MKEKQIMMDLRKNTVLQELTIADGTVKIDKSTLGNGREQVESILLPASLRTIGAETFRNCRSLRRIHIPLGVVSIGASAFLGCSSLEQVVIPDSVIYLGAAAFAYCTSLKRVVLSNNLYAISDCLFAGCTSLEKPAWPESLESFTESSLADMPQVDGSWHPNPDDLSFYTTAGNGNIILHTI
jgi:hypothetical protein